MMNRNYGLMGGSMSGSMSGAANGARCGAGYDRSSVRRAVGAPPRGGASYSSPRAPQGVCGCGCGNNGGYGNGNGTGNGNRNGSGNGNRVRPSSAASRSGSCGCGGDERSSCKKLMEQIRAVDFALYETVLYLDVYPHSCDALETYHKLKSQSEALHREYESTCGPLSAFGNQSTTSWDWMSKPFPGEYDAD